jgi:hypothetical protein
MVALDVVAQTGCYVRLSLLSINRGRLPAWEAGGVPFCVLGAQTGGCFRDETLHASGFESGMAGAGRTCPADVTCRVDAQLRRVRQVYGTGDLSPAPVAALKLS